MSLKSRKKLINFLCRSIFLENAHKKNEKCNQKMWFKIPLQFLIRMRRLLKPWKKMTACFQYNRKMAMKSQILHNYGYLLKKFGHNNTTSPFLENKQLNIFDSKIKFKWCLSIFVKFNIYIMVFKTVVSRCI